MASKNIVLKGATWNGVESIDLPVSGGGTARFVETSDSDAVAADVASGKTCYVNGSKITGTASGGGGSWSWMGENPTLVKDYDKIKVFLKDSPYATWTPTTTQTTFASATNMDAATNIDLGSHDYVITYKWHTHFEYDGTETGKNQISDYYFFSNHDCGKFHSSYDDMVNGSKNGVGKVAGPSSYGLFYKNTSGSDRYVQTYSGVFISSITTPNHDSTNLTLTPKIPAIYASCSNSYFSAANASAVDQDKSYYEFKVQIWQVDTATSNSINNYFAIRDMWLNGI